MSNLDDVLHAVLHELGARYYFEGDEIDEDEYQDYIKTIRQAFSDADWEPHTTKLKRLHQHLKELEEYVRDNT